MRVGFRTLRLGLIIVVCIILSHQGNVAQQQLTCVGCGVGSFLNVDGECQACPGNSSTYTGVNATSMDDCVCKPNYFNSTAWVCEPCPNNTFKTELGNTTCISCDTSPEACVCPPGYEGDPSTSCIPCGQGYYGYYNSNLSAYICTACPPNTYNVLDAATTVEACQPCPSNSTSGAGSGSKDACVCNAGFYTSTVTGSDAWTSWTCLACPPGSFSTIPTASNATTCELCPAGTYSTATHATSADTCVPCANGSYSVEAGQSACVLCSVSTWQDLHGPTPYSTECTPCPPHSHHNKLGSVSIHDCLCDANYAKSAPNSTSQAYCTCKPGYYSLSEPGTCYKCPPGFYCAGGTSKLPCPSNSTSFPGAGFIENCTCAEGTWRDCILLRNGSGIAMNASGELCTIDYLKSCTPCMQNVICVNNSVLHCPEHSTAPAGSGESHHCTCDDGYFNHEIEHDESGH